VRDADSLLGAAQRAVNFNFLTVFTVSLIDPASLLPNRHAPLQNHPLCAPQPASRRGGGDPAVKPWTNWRPYRLQFGFPRLPKPPFMPSADPSITLLQLGLRGEPMSFAPHVWKTLLPLRLLQVPFKVELVTLRELRDDLPTRLGVEKVTLPVSFGFPITSALIKYNSEALPPQTLLVDEGGTTSIIMDSYRIALWVSEIDESYRRAFGLRWHRSLLTPASLQLNQRFGTEEKSLFGTPHDALHHTGQAFARFIETWVDRSFAATLRACVLHTSYAHFVGDDAQPYFLAKCGQAKMDELTALNADEDWLRQKYEESRKQ